MQCNVDALSRYIDGDLSLPETLRLEQHLNRCARCTEELEGLRRRDRIIQGWSLRSVAVPAELEQRMARDLRRRRRFSPLLALSKVMPAAVGTSVAALLVLVTASLGGPYANRSQSAAFSQAQVKNTVVRQSAQLIMNRRMQAVVGIRTSQRTVGNGRHFQLDEN
jgi:anti-sigma factor RsiW